MNRKLQKEMKELQLELAKWGGRAEVIEELRKLPESKELKEFIVMKTTEFWVETVPLGQAICDKNIELAEDYMKNG